VLSPIKLAILDEKSKLARIIHTLTADRREIGGLKEVPE
jgi:hypothetical protein